jgi:uncharacterized protein (TIGR03067 family)
MKNSKYSRSAAWATAVWSIALGGLVLVRAALAADSEAGFQPMFNGKDLAGWIGNPKLWSVQDGAIMGRTTAEDPLKINTFLIWTNGEPGDFELRCEFKIMANNNQGFANSGIQYRSKVLDPKNWVVGGYQADMEAGANYTGILYEERMTRGIMATRGEKVLWNQNCEKTVTGSLGKSEELQAAIKKEAWNDYVIIAKGNHLQHFINGKQTVDVIDECESKRAMKGVIALQLHQGQPMTVQFKNLRLKQTSSEHAANDNGDDLRQIQGTWQVSGAQQNGESLNGENVTNTIVIVTGNSYRTLGGNQVDRGTFAIDPAKSPKQMDIKSGTSGEVLLAIYEVGPDHMRVCYALQGDRPAGFTTSTADPQILLLDYKRKKD